MRKAINGSRDRERHFFSPSIHHVAVWLLLLFPICDEHRNYTSPANTIERQSDAESQVFVAGEIRSPRLIESRGNSTKRPNVPSDSSRIVDLILLREHAKTNVRSAVSAPSHARVSANLEARFYITVDGVRSLNERSAIYIAVSHSRAFRLPFTPVTYIGGSSRGSVDRKAIPNHVVWSWVTCDESSIGDLSMVPLG